MSEPIACPHCGCDDKQQLEPWREPVSQIPEEAAEQRAIGQKWFCGQCGRTWVVQRLPFDGPKQS